MDGGDLPICFPNFGSVNRGSLFPQVPNFCLEGVEVFTPPLSSGHHCEPRFFRVENIGDIRGIICGNFCAGSCTDFQKKDFRRNIGGIRRGFGGYKTGVGPGRY